MTQGKLALYSAYSIITDVLCDSNVYDWTISVEIVISIQASGAILWDAFCSISVTQVTRARESYILRNR